ncbi:MAG: hypothetical protein JEZ08_01845 [Clostridiales bacterium]|nr:hypothetical protein [Clostridiales bacterium]
MDKNKIIDLTVECKEVESEIEKLKDKMLDEDQKVKENHNDIDALINRVNNLGDLPNNITERFYNIDTYNDITFTDSEFIDVSFNEVKDGGKLSEVDILVSGLSGILSSIIDIVFVGTPDIVKIYRGGEQFDGSILTKLFRKIGNDSEGKQSEVLKWLSEKCKVPYDISLEKGVVTPNNHRLRNFAHDPLFGLLFAFADIVMGTTTAVDNTGALKVLVNNGEFKANGLNSIFYYLGHLLSDFSTARGLPIPGAGFSQFFAGKGENSFARIAEDMYSNGYDFRHMMSMGIPVFIKKVILEFYFKITDDKISGVTTISELEMNKINNNKRHQKMYFISDVIATSGNVLKFVTPPFSGNPNSINTPQWLSMIKSTIGIIRMSNRDKSGERVINNRNQLESNWKELSE